jgi:regulator of protease activity HflC (stomatin/prohibitin superfamily)
MGAAVGFALAAVIMLWGLFTSIATKDEMGRPVQWGQAQGFRLHRPFRLLGSLLAALAVYRLVLWSVIIIPGAHVACVYDPLRGGIQDATLPEGLHLIAPWVRTEVFSVQTQEYTMSIAAKEGAVMGDDSIKCETNEGLKVLLDLTVLFHIDSQHAPRLWRKLGANYNAIFVRPVVRERIRMTVAKYSVQEVYSSLREKIAQEITAELSQPFAEEGLVLEQILLRNVSYGHPEFAEVISEKQARQQQVITEQRLLERAEFEKQATVNKARGEARSLTLRAQTLVANPQVVRYEMVQKMAPRVRKAYLSEHSMPLPLGGGQ